MLITGPGTSKAGSQKGWQAFVKRHRQLVRCLGLLFLTLLLVAGASFLLQIQLHQHQSPDRLSSPFSLLQTDHPMTSSAFAKGYSAGIQNGSPQPSPAHKVSASFRKSRRFYQAAIAAAAQGGVVLQWGDATVRLLRGVGANEVFFLFYDPAASPAAEGVKANNYGSANNDFPADPLKIFKQLALEGRNDQQRHQLPFVAVPRQEMHKLSFFLPEYAEKSLPLAMVVRLDSGWTKFQAPAKAAFSLPALRDFLSSYRNGTLAPLLRTEALPPLNRGHEAVIPLVAANFSRVILEQISYDALVLLYANWCGHCRRFQKIMLQLAERFRGISSIAFFKLDVSRNDVPVPGLRVERVPHVVFFTRDPERKPKNAASISPSKSVEASRAAAAAAAELGDPHANSWHVGEGIMRKKLFTFSHAQPNVLNYGEAFLLQHAACKTINLETGSDCVSKNSEDL